MRIRCIKPTFWTDAKLAKLPVLTRLAFIGLWNIADDEGRFQADPRLIKAALFPLNDDINSVKVQGVLTELSVNQRIRLYTVNGEDYGEIPNFRKHQRINRPSESLLPPFTESSVNPHAVLGEPSVTEKEREKEVEKEGKGKAKRADALPPSDFPENLNVPEFRALWDKFLAHRRQIRKPMSQVAIELQLKRLSGMGLSRALQAVERSAANGWQGVHEDQQKTPPQRSPAQRRLSQELREAVESARWFRDNNKPEEAAACEATVAELKKQLQMEAV